MDFEKKELAYCGIYCIQCSFRTANDTGNRNHLTGTPSRYDHYKVDELSACYCEGCKGDNICGPCKMQDCAREKKLECCAECGEFPCPLLDAFGNDGIPHHKAAVQNLHNIKQSGYEQWFREFAKELQCGKCGERLSWYYDCPVHGKNE